MSSLPRTLTLVLATVGALATGCDSTQEPTVTKEEAVQRVAARAEEAVQHLPPGATLKQTLHQDDIACDDQDRDGAQFVETNYQVMYPQGWPVDQSMTTLSDYWDANGYQVIRDDRDDANHPELVVEKKTDRFRIGYLISRRDNGTTEVFLRSSSPCFQP